MSWTTRIRLLVGTLWVGSLWTIGYLVAPTLFATLPDQRLAGTIAGSLFRIEAWLSLACALLLGLLAWRFSADVDAAMRKSWLRLIGLMLVCLLIGYFGLQPFMEALRTSAAAAGGVMDTDARTKFSVLHGIASGFYLAQSVLGVLLILKLR